MGMLINRRSENPFELSQWRWRQVENGAGSNATRACSVLDNTGKNTAGRGDHPWPDHRIVKMELLQTGL
jgi:hypothetical protein